MSKSRTVRLDRDLRRQLGPTAIAKLEAAVNGAAFAHEGIDRRAAILRHAGIALLADDEARHGRLLSGMYEKDSVNFSKNAEAAKELVRQLGLERSRKEQLPAQTDDQDMDSTPDDELFVEEFRQGRAIAEEEDAPRAVIRPAGRTLKELYGPAACQQATQDVMKEPDPFARVLTAARAIRGGAPVDRRGLHYFKQ